MRVCSRPRWWIWGTGAVLLAGTLVGSRLVNNPSRADETPAAASESAHLGKGVVCFGYVDMEHGITELHPLVPGRVTRVEVREDQAVQAGTVLLRLDDYQAQRRVREAEADLAAAQEQLGQALKGPEQHEARLAQQRAGLRAVQHRLKGGRHLLTRKRDLVDKKLLNPIEAEAAEALVQELEALERVEIGKLTELELNDPSAGVRSAKASVAARQARLEQSRKAVEECCLKAPVDGTILRMSVNPGDVLGPQPKQPAVLFCARGRRVIRAEVEQEFAGRVAVGQTALIQDDASGGPTWPGRVLRLSDWYTQRRSILPEPAQFHDVRTLECLIAIDAEKAPLRIGQRVRVTLRPGR
jgi:multidrug resistance efflux pump